MHLINLFKKLLTPTEQSTTAPKQKPVLLEHSVMHRDSQQNDKFDAWIDTYTHREFLSIIQHNFTWKNKSSADLDKAVRFIGFSTLNGFTLSLDPDRWVPIDFVHLMDFFKERILSQTDYYCDLADIKKIQHANGIEEVQRYYLKPPHPDVGSTDPWVQGFGNIMICLEQKPESHPLLKLSATHYNGRQYAEPEDFDELMQIICTNR